MNHDPRRLKDDGPEGLRDLLRQGEAPPPMTAEQRAAGAALIAKLGTAGAGGAAGAGATFAASGAGKFVLIAGGLATVGALVFGGGALLVEPSERDPSRRAAAAPATPEPPVPTRVTVPTVQAVMPMEMEAALPPAPPVEAAADEAPRARAPAPRNDEAPADALMAEAGLLESARQHLRGDPAAALRDTRRHAARFPNAQLASERELIAIDALRRLGRTAQARRRATSLLRRAPRGMYADRAQRILNALDAD